MPFFLSELHHFHKDFYQLKEIKENNMLPLINTLVETCHSKPELTENVVRIKFSTFILEPTKINTKFC